MSPDADAAKVFEGFKLADVPRISDPRKVLYRAFGLESGSLLQIAGPSAMLRGVGSVLKHGLGVPRGDVTQMPGAFLLKDGQIVRAFRHQTSSDRPDYLALI